MSILGRSRMVSAGAVRRLGPSVSPGNRIPIQMERAHVEMIEVRMGKKHDVDLGEVTNGQRGRGQAFRSECKSGQPDSDPDGACACRNDRSAHGKEARCRSWGGHEWSARARSGV